jgi:hypothetical protein
MMLRDEEEISVSLVWKVADAVIFWREGVYVFVYSNR